MTAWTKRSALPAASARLPGKSAFRSRRFRTGSAFPPSACSRSKRRPASSRTILRPDLYGNGPADRPRRRRGRPPRARRNTRCSPRCSRARPIARCSSGSPRLRGDASPLGLAHAALAEAASRTTSERVEREYFDLFIGLGRGELLPYGSYYLTGFLHERPLARLREDLAQARHRARRRSGRTGRSRRDPVRDHGRPCERHACRRRRRRSRTVREASGALDRAFLRRSGAGRGRRFLSSTSAALGRVFMEIETEAFALPS